MRMSVCVVTVRPGGIDVLLAGLRRQEFDSKDFEVVLVDGLYERRREEVADRFAQARLSLVHTLPRVRNFPIDSVPAYRNTALAKARGDLILWLVDFSWCPPGLLREHWGVWECFEKTKAGMGAHQYLFPPAVTYPLPPYAPIRRFKPHEEPGVTYNYLEEDSYAFARDVELGFYDRYMYSVFAEPLEAPEQIGALREDPYFFHADPKLTGLTGGQLDGKFFHAKNEGVPRELALAVNGFDEGYDGHLYDDSDMGYRLEHVGAQWVLLDPQATVQIINPRHLFPHLIRRSLAEAHLQKYEAVRRDGEKTRADNGYVLEDVSWNAGRWWYG